MEGSIFLHRQLIDSAVFASEKRLKIWIWLLLKASYKDRFVKIVVGKGETVIKLQRGQLLFGRFKAEEQTGIDGSTIYKILQWMSESEKMINIESNSHYSIITINNYDTFQVLEQEKVTPIEQSSNSQVTADEQPSNTYKKDNKDKKDNNKIYQPELISLNEACKKYFDEKYIGKKSLECFDKLTRIDNYSIEQIKKAILNAKTDRFWANKFLSPVKLREKNKEEVLYIDLFLTLKQNGTIQTHNSQNEKPAGLGQQKSLL